MNDPLDHIMSTLRDKGGIDPNRAAQRKASMKRDRGAVPSQVGGSVGPKPKRVQARPVEQQPSPEEGREGDVQVAPVDMTPLIVDQMNEAIVTIKVQIHREEDPERRRQLEQQANNLRQQITSLGGDPIRADESVEEGLSKLQGYGFVGFRQLGAESSNPRKWYNIDTTAKTTTPKSPAPAPAPKPAAPAPTLSIPAPRAAPTAAPPPPARKTKPGYFTDALETSPAQPFDELTSILDDIGQQKAVRSAPALQVDTDFVSNLVTEMGLQPRTPEEIEAHATAVVERQVWERSQIIQRELDRFESTFPEEFARAEKQIKEYAANLSAERQEEFASRGMFYSSVMAGALTEIDTTSMELIGDIARDAAQHVTELRADIRDIEEWGVLEREVVRRELEAIDRAERERLMNIHLEVAMRADQFALDTWYREQQLALEERAQVVNELQFRVAEAERMGMHLSMAHMADHPVVQGALRDMGVTAKAFQRMPLEQQANMVQSVAHYEQVEQQMRMNEVQMKAILADISIQEQKLALQRAQFAESSRQFSAQMAAQQDVARDQTLTSRQLDAYEEGIYAAQIGDWDTVDSWARSLNTQGRPDLAAELRELKRAAPPEPETREAPSWWQNLDMGGVFGGLHRSQTR